MVNITQFVTSYLETALWSSLNDQGEPLDALYDLSTDLGEGTVLRAEKDCREFLELAKPYLRDDVDLLHVAHDFALTRNRHGSGFWDDEKRYGVSEANKLTELAQSFGECNLYVGDDSKLYIE